MQALRVFFGGGAKRIVELTFGVNKKGHRSALDTATMHQIAYENRESFETKYSFRLVPELLLHCSRSRSANL